MRLLIAVILLTVAASTAHANDAAVEVSAGGLKLRKERSVLMEKERLHVTKELVTVEYQFRNTTGKAIESEVAFPIPPYQFDPEPFQRSSDFSDFTAWVDERPVKVEKEVRAFVKQREVTKELQKAGISIEGFGGFAADPEDNQIMKLDRVTRDRLVGVGALTAPGQKDGSGYSPRWETRISYHWRQLFPPGATVRVRHQYRPVIGFESIQIQNLKKEIKDACLGACTYGEAKRRVDKMMKGNPGINNYMSASWVSYILTTANTWQTPIKDFELVVEGEKDELISFCWDGPVEKTAAAKLRAHKTDFVPRNNLKVYFFGGWENF